jgi:hypothetical protein
VYETNDKTNLKTGGSHVSPQFDYQFAESNASAYCARAPACLLLGLRRERQDPARRLEAGDGTGNTRRKTAAGRLNPFRSLAGRAAISSDAGAVTDESGAFELRAGEGQGEGASPGLYRVVISRLVMPDGSTVIPDETKSPIQLALEGAKETVPPQYSDLAFSKLTATVPSDGGNLEFKLTTRGM